MEFGVDRSEFGDDLPWIAAAGTRAARILDPDHGDLFPPGVLNDALDIRDHGVALVVPTDHAVLHIDNEERGIGPVLECGHRSPLGAYHPQGGIPSQGPGFTWAPPRRSATEGPGDMEVPGKDPDQSAKASGGGQLQTRLRSP